MCEAVSSDSTVPTFQSHSHGMRKGMIRGGGGGSSGRKVIGWNVSRGKTNIYLETMKTNNKNTAHLDSGVSALVQTDTPKMEEM